MSFILRRPGVASASVKLFAKQPSCTSSRLFHSSFRSAFRNAKESSHFTKSGQSFQNVFRRTYLQPVNQASGGNQGSLSQKLFYGAAVVGGTIVATNAIFNRETREDGGMPPHERSYLNETFMHTGLGIGIIGFAAKTLHSNGWSYRLMATNPWLVVGVSLVAGMGSMFGTFYTSPEK